MYLSAAKARLLSEVMVTLAEPHEEAQIRQRIGEQLLGLLEADHYASYVWNDEAGIFMDRVALNMCPRNLSAYEAYYQYHDPITSLLQQRRGPTLVGQVMPQSELVRTEFFNDFLYRDGLYWGVNLYAWDGDRNIGDMRIWRGRRRDNFDAESVGILELIRPAFTAALKRARKASALRAAPDRLTNVPAGSREASACLPAPGWSVPAEESAPTSRLLSGREAEVARLAAIGWPDKAIARRLGIGFTTVRTHLGHAFRKLGVQNRVQLASCLAGAPAGPRRAPPDRRATS
ncbi:MAG: helix-turn-helix transcriptional regulator [Burkholderiaceae bacterium]|nr:helix-turn-helix transcriptional regulator [Burkholderiaceae bacterium]